ncbi:hypothetical protein ABZ345_08430 [Lentzea sp. NPDC005914]|uniref:hypothetical protein n=1 Tax=Lentzea sp. NPDC005914 TaxID=3154572 RepID=UPI003410D7BD
MDQPESAGATSESGAPGGRVPLWGSALTPTAGESWTPAPLPEAPPEDSPQRSNGFRIAVVVGAVAFLAVSAVVVVSLVRDKDNSTPGGTAGGPVATPAFTTTQAVATNPATTSYRYPTTSAPVRPTTTTASLLVPQGFQRVSGPGGITLAIPQGWPITPGSLATHVQADDPATPGSLIRYGGSPSESRPLLDAVASNEQDNSGIQNGYQRLKLASVPSATATDIVEWEFTYLANGITKHAFARYWRLNGTDYIVYAGATAAAWPAMASVVDVMVRTAGPLS